MRIRLITITHKAPAWIQTGYQDYAKRLPAHFSLELVEIPAEKRLPNADIARITQREGDKMLSAIQKQHYVVALDVKGKLFSTEDLATKLTTLASNGQHLDLLVGGPEGLATSCLQVANEKWSLSPLTFPHILVRLIVAEQIYRAYTITTGHPYHR